MAETTETAEEAVESTAEETFDVIAPVFRVLEGIQSGSIGTPRFSNIQSVEQINDKIELFNSTNQITLEDFYVSDDDIFILNSLNFENDIMLIRQTELNNPNSIPYYTIERNAGEGFESFKSLQYNYNMTTDNVDMVLDRILKNIAIELSPPKNSKTFTYDFKFAKNRNRSIVTGSASATRTRSTTTGGGGY
jgi:hypothetical protein